MRLFLSLSMFFCLVCACEAQATIRLTDSTYAIIPYTGKDYRMPFKNAKEASLSEIDLRQIEYLANKGIAEYNKQTKWGKIDHTYKTQIVPVINKNGEKEVWLNCFCDAYPDWRKNILEVRDGGSCFFKMKINLSKEKCYDISVNGEA